MADPVLVQSASGPGTLALTTATLPGPASGGNFLVLVAVTAAYKVADPAGWTLASEQKGNHGHTVWYRQAVGGETTVAYDIGGDFPSLWWIGELGPIVSPSFDIATGSVLGFGSSTFATAAITPTLGRRYILATVAGSGSGGNTAVGGWTNGFTALGDARSTPGAGDQHFVGIAGRGVDADGVATFSTTATLDPPGTNSSRSGVTLSLKAIPAPNWQWTYSVRNG